ncbi:MAG TPA: undecaprenyldiphospho-muramoylpentapeptide beta-N-acetylglucosaminyltransferase [Longimicrobiales bacterium]|nr:undecaprenyldiphospho-muramoylpentapeptide beta-N-acetylglucosaminyltransferase [Longimicrobiales bacterium]
MTTPMPVVQRAPTGRQGVLRTKHVIMAGGGTGGHLYPALALGSALQAKDSRIQVHYVGARRGVEAHVLPARNVPHTLLPLQPIRRDRIWQNWRLVPAVFGTVYGLAKLFMKLRPALVVGTGGYASGPAAMWAVLTAIPMAVQEQNSHPGFTTRVLARWAQQVHLGFPEAAQLLRPGRATRVFSFGNPIQPPQLLDGPAVRGQFELTSNAVVLLVVGGSQGARAVNEALLGALERVARRELPPRPAQLEILWGTGPAHIDAVNARLQPLGLPWVHAHGYIEAMPSALAATDVAVSRAGAMATAELLAWGRPMLLIPLPTAAADHQTHNARALEQAGAAIMLREAELTPARLWQEIIALTGDAERRAHMQAVAQARARPNAAHEIADHLYTLIAA